MLQHKFGGNKGTLEARWLFPDADRGWGLCPALEYPAGTQDMESVHLPSPGEVAKELFALMALALDSVPWDQNQLAAWLSKVEALPPGYDEESQGEWVPTYENLPLDRSVPSKPKLVWCPYPGMSQPGPVLQGKYTTDPPLGDD